MTYLLIAEKPSAAKNMAKALGGMSGSFEGQDYKIVPLFGHMMEFTEPHLMVEGKDVQTSVQSWSPGEMPWDLSEFNWQRVPQKTKNPRTGKISSKADGIRDVASAAKGCSAVVIATDKDPSGEGQLIGWEVIQAIKWSGPVKRMYFIDESEKGLKQGFRDIEDLPHYSKDGEYIKADTRSKWDFVSMQLTRLSTSAARSKGYSVVVRQGRLKSVMTKLVADQLALVKAYKKKPYYEVKYKDDKGNVFTRPFDADTDQFRFNQKADAEADMKQYSASDVVEDSKTRKETAPGKLLDLGGLASILGAKGYKSKEVLATYQKMYEAKIVSYPRTEDKIISHEQFNEMKPLIGKIAGVVGADPALLTHTAPRKTHVKDGGAHGANRPGTVVPASLDSLSKYGPSAKAIYQTLARNFLAMFGENYVYDSIKGHIKDHPAFVATVSVPVSMGFKAIFDAEAESKDDGDSDDENAGSKGLGSTGQPTVAEGVNKKPPHPSHKWLEKQLSKYDVGTGATRVSTLSEVTNGKTALLVDTKGKLTLTQIGEIAAVLLDGSQIGNPAVTEKLFVAMRKAGDFELSPDAVLKTATSIVTHDKEVFFRNAKKLEATVGAPSGDAKGFVKKEKVSGVYAPTGETIQFNVEWSGHRFSDQEVKQLLAGESIEIEAVSKKTGKPFKAPGKLAQGEFKGRKFWGFQAAFKGVDDYTIDTAPIPASWSGYTFTDADKTKLRAGEKVTVKAVSKKTGNPYTADVTFEIVEFNGNKRWGIKPHFEEKKAADSYTRADAPFKTEFGGYTLTEKEVADVRAGGGVLVTAKSKKSGKPYTCTVTLELKEYKGRKYWGLEPQFD